LRVELQFRRFFESTKQSAQVNEVHVIVNENLIEKFREAKRQLGAYSKGKQEFVTNFPQLGQSYLDYLTETAAISDYNSNPTLAWHGAKAIHLDSICWYGLLNLSTTDEGWYGRGIYLTQCPNYGQLYITDQQQKEQGSYELLLCWVLLGKPCPVTNLMVGGQCVSGFSSHYVVINNKYHPKQLDEPVYGDEIIVFNSSHVLPCFIVKYSLTNK